MSTAAQCGDHRREDMVLGLHGAHGPGTAGSTRLPGCWQATGPMFLKTREVPKYFNFSKTTLATVWEMDWSQGERGVTVCRVVCFLRAPLGNHWKK